MLDRTTLFTARIIEPMDRQIVVDGRWSIATDGLQWILQRRRGQRWESLSFVRTTRDILARCMREKGASPGEMAFLAVLPDRFQEAPQTDLNKCSVRSGSVSATPCPTWPSCSGGRHEKTVQHHRP